MTVHAHLARMVAARGADVLADPVEFRAALDDYLTDDEISPGDRNVLVDAVRLDAVRRLVDLLDHGSDPRAAVNEAGLALARERGSDDARRSLRATAQLGYAAGRLDDEVVREFDVATPAAPFPSPPQPSPEAFAPTHVIAPADAPRARSAGRAVLLVGSGLALLLVVGAGVWWFLLRGGTPEDTVDEFFAAHSCEDAAELLTGAAAEQVQTEIDLGDDSTLCPTYGDYTSEYDVTEADDRGDRATVEVNGTQHYDGIDEAVADQRDFTAVFDLRRVDGEWLVSNVNWTYADE